MALCESYLGFCMNRFCRVEQLLGRPALEKLKNARVAVFGLGAVGSYAVLTRQVCQGNASFSIPIICSSPNRFPFISSSVLLLRRRTLTENCVLSGDQVTAANAFPL